MSVYAFWMILYLNIKQPGATELFWPCCVMGSNPRLMFECMILLCWPNVWHFHFIFHWDTVASVHLTLMIRWSKCSQSSVPLWPATSLPVLARTSCRATICLLSSALRTSSSSAVLTKRPSIMGSAMPLWSESCVPTGTVWAHWPVFIQFVYSNWSDKAAFH